MTTTDQYDLLGVQPFYAGSAPVPPNITPPNNPPDFTPTNKPDFTPPQPHYINNFKWLNEQ